MRAILLLSAVLLAASCVHAVSPRTTVGTRFIAGFGRNFIGYNLESTNLTITVTALDRSAKIRIRGATGGNIAKFDLAPRASRVVRVDSAKYQADINGVVTQSGVEVTSSVDVAVSVANIQRFSTDATTVFPRRSLGREYVVGSYEYSVLNADDEEPAPSCLQVIASNSNTHVQVNLRAAVKLNGATVGPGLVTFELPKRLDSVALCVFEKGGDISGSTVRASKDVAVFGFEVCAYVPTTIQFCDLLLEQSLPTSALGVSTVIIPIALRVDGDIIRFVAAYNDTSFSVNGQQVATLSAGEVYEFTNPSDAYSYVRSSKPAQFFQYAKGGNPANATGDPFMTTLPAAAYWLADYSFATIAGYQNFVAIAVNTSDIASVRLNGDALSSATWHAVDQSGYSATTISLGTDAGTYRVVSTTGAAMEVQVYGLREIPGGELDSYGFSAGQSFKPRQ